MRPHPFVTVAPPSTGLYRLARGPADPFEPQDWSFAHEDGTFGNRFDDPGPGPAHAAGPRFRAVYCATQRIAAFGETLARFRPSLTLLAQLALIDDDEPVADALAGVIDPGDPARAIIPADWRLRRRIGHTILDPSLVFVDIAAAETMQYLRIALAPLAATLGLTDIDLSSVTSPQRRITQACARYIFDIPESDAQPRFAGIHYPSRLNPNWECWAVFDRDLHHLPGWPGFPESIPPDDPDLLAAATLYGLTVETL